jgi:cytidylate kinase
VADRPAKFGERVLARLATGLPELVQAAPADDDLVAGYRREIERLMGEAARGGNVVILGRFGNAVLQGRPDLVRVFITAPLDWRIENVRRSLGIDAAAARAEIGRIDDARRTFARDQHGIAWGAIENYDLIVDTARFGVDGSAQTIAAAVRAASAE